MNSTSSDNFVSTSDLIRSAIQSNNVSNNSVNDKQVQIIDLVGEKDRFACKSCNLLFSSLTDLNTHHMVHHRDWKLKCPECPQEFLDLIGFCAHKNSHGNSAKTQNEVIQPIFVCEACSESFPNPLLYQVHMKTFHGTKERLESTAKKMKLDEDKFVCEICRHPFKNIIDMNYHFAKYHSKTMGRYCSECSKEFSNDLLYVQHMKSFHGINEGELIEHSKYLQKQGGFARFTCKICQSVFKHRDSVKRHVKIKHNTIDEELEQNIVRNAEANIKQSNFRCEYCHQKFATRIGLRDHIKGIHERIRSVCKLCKKSMSTKRDLRRHLRLKHSLTSEEDLQNSMYLSNEMKVLENSNELLCHVTLIP